jgi:hypothetical protein
LGESVFYYLLGGLMAAARDCFEDDRVQIEILCSLTMPSPLSNEKRLCMILSPLPAL